MLFADFMHVVKTIWTKLVDEKFLKSICVKSVVDNLQPKQPLWLQGIHSITTIPFLLYFSPYVFIGTVPMQVATQNVKMTFCPNSLTQPSNVKRSDKIRS